MMKRPLRSRTDAARADDHERAIEHFFAHEALSWLAHPNVAGVMLGKKRVAGKATEQDAIVFRVDRKLDDRSEILAIGSKPFPAEIEIGGKVYPTDVLEGGHRASDGGPVASGPRRRFPFICGGISIGNAGVAGDAGTGTAVVRQRSTGKLALLSCDHVLRRRDGNRFAIQPGQADNGGGNDVFGELLGGIRALEGDAAIAAIERRPAEARIAGLAVAVDRVSIPTAGDLVVKAGRSSGVSFGRVSARVGVMRVVYRDSEPIGIRGFEIDCLDGQVTRDGDSGAPWLLADPATRQPLGTLVGVHTANTPDGTGAFACFAPSVFEQLGIDLPGPSDFGAVKTMAPTSSPLLTVTARSGLILRTGAGREFDPIQTLPFGSTVRRIGAVGSWTKVDLQGDGAADGFVYSPFLAPAAGLSTSGQVVVP